MERFSISVITAVSKYNVGHVSIDACGHYVTPGFVEPHCQLGVREQVFRFEGDDSDESTVQFFRSSVR